MWPMRKRIVNGLILGILGLTALSMIVKKEGWPICTYPMFDWIHHRHDQRITEFFTVTDAGETRLKPGTAPWRGTFGLMRNVGLEEALWALLDQKGWYSESTNAFLKLILRELDREWKAGNQASGRPRALRVYLVDYRYPETGPDLRPQVLNRALKLEVHNVMP